MHPSEVASGLLQVESNFPVVMLQHLIRPGSHTREDMIADDDRRADAHRSMSSRRGHACRTDTALHVENG
jgi:hypothetical protein